MTKIDKTLQKMRENPHDWRLESLETIAKRFGITVRKTGGRHAVFLHKNSSLVVTIPVRRPIKPVYISHFLALIDDIGV